jgi:dTMP kinase
MFFVFEGADGVGKSTQAKLLAEHIRMTYGSKVLLLREPGGTPVGEKVRRILLDPATGDLETSTELFLFMAARAHLTARCILPAVRRGEVVICDRYLWSSVVYQGIVGGLGIGEVLRAGRLAGVLQPTRTFLIDVPPRLAYSRVDGGDRMESRGRRFQEGVRRGFLELARRSPRNVAVIDGRGEPREVGARIVERLPARGWSSCSR